MKLRYELIIRREEGSRREGREDHWLVRLMIALMTALDESDIQILKTYVRIITAELTIRVKDHIR